MIKKIVYMIKKIEEEKSGGKSLLPNNKSNENTNKDHFYYLNLKFNILINSILW